MEILKINGGYITVLVPAEDVFDFNAQRPCSNVPVTDIEFEFDRTNRDLVGIQPVEGDSADFDGEALKALADDAQAFAFQAAQ